MTQNIYDDDQFFKGYSQLPRSIHGLAGAPEWASLRALIPDIKQQNILDLGCGFGWFCRWAAENGAEHVLGIDVSERMLARAREMTRDGRIAYIRADLESLTLQTGRYDLVYSSLVFHYLENLQLLMGEIYRSLLPGGAFVFSVEHPLTTAPIRPQWQVDGGRRVAWPVDSYQVEGPRSTNWLTDGVIKQHRTLETYVNLLIDTGFRLAHLQAWLPTEEQLREHPDWEDEKHRPTFLLVSARR
jgi:SAM-dependent methyltransferase